MSNEMERGEFSQQKMKDFSVIEKERDDAVGGREGGVKA